MQTHEGLDTDTLVITLPCKLMELCILCARVGDWNVILVFEFSHVFWVKGKKNKGFNSWISPRKFNFFTLVLVKICCLTRVSVINYIFTIDKIGIFTVNMGETGIFIITFLGISEFYHIFFALLFRWVFLGINFSHFSIFFPKLKLFFLIV